MNEKDVGAAGARSVPLVAIAAAVMVVVVTRADMSVANAAPGTDVADADVAELAASAGVPGDEGGWSFTRYQPPPEGRDWHLLHRSAQGGVDGSHPRITRDETIDGVSCYRHRVRQGDEVQMVDDRGPIVKVDLSRHDRALLRFHLWRDNYHRVAGKDIAWMGGYGYQGDMVRNADGRFNPPLTTEQAFGSTEGAVANSMHPVRKRGTQDGVRLLASHAREVPAFKRAAEADNALFDDGYYGDNVGSKVALPLKRWVTIDIVVHRTEGYAQYVDGELAGRSAEHMAETAPFDDWDAQQAVWYWHRHMYGGNPEKLLALEDVDECFGGFYLAVD